MKDTDAEFARHVAILAEASRINDSYAHRVLQATDDAQIDALVDEGKDIIDDAADQAWI